jgi:hypothetical protein
MFSFVLCWVGKKTALLSHLYIKCIILPRQARDKHRENSQKVPFSLRYDLSRPELTDDQRRFLAWPSQWEEHSLGDYGPGVADATDADVDGMFKPAKL